MKKHELLKYAYDKYPKGANYKNLALGSKETSSGSFKIDVDGVFDQQTKTFVFGINKNYPWSGKWAEIIEQPKSILDGKCAIQVNNEREFELLMKHYEEKGWKWNSGKLPTVRKFNKTDDCIDYHDGFAGATKDYQNQLGYTIIPFSDFAKEVGIEVPIYAYNDYNGNKMFVGDLFYMVCTRIGNPMDFSNLRILEKQIEKGSGQSWESHYKDENDVWYWIKFSTREAAEKWIAQQNKPNKIEIRLYDAYNSCVVKENSVNIINTTTGIIELAHSDIEEILHAIQQLKGGDNA